MKILFLTQWFDPEPFFKGINYVKKLQETGHKVQVLTGFPNYPSGKVYDGYKIRLWKDEVIGDISILRTFLYPNHDNSSVKRAINYLSFTFSSTIFGIFKLKKPELVYVYHPPITVGITALILKRIWKVPYVYEIQDIWPDTLRATGMVNNKYLMRLIDRLCTIIYKNADRLTVISPGFKDKLISMGINPEQIDVIYNPCDETSNYPRKGNQQLAKKLKLNGKFNIIFAGNMGRAQALEAVLKSAELVQNNYPEIQFVFIGGGIDENRLRNCAKDLNLNNTLFLERVPLSKIGDIIALADIALVHLKGDPLFKITIPGKTQTYMASSKPIIMGVEGDAANLVIKANAGLACIPEDPKSISDAVLKLYNLPKEELINLGKNGRKYYESELSLDVMFQKLNKVFDKAIKSYL
jgi:colanic acid biosynthesis glycosyl transferase WcaI